jgi:hypothetical protein
METLAHILGGLVILGIGAFLIQKARRNGTNTSRAGRYGTSRHAPWSK